MQKTIIPDKVVHKRVNRTEIGEWYTIKGFIPRQLSHLFINREDIQQSDK